MITDIKAQVAQLTPVVAGEQDMTYLKSTKLGALFTADWREQMILAGLGYSVRCGGVTTSADIAPILGGGSGTVIDAAQPELIVGVDAGYYMIVMEAACSAYTIPASAAITNIILYADRGFAPGVGQQASAAIATPVNLLDGGPAFPGRGWQNASGDLAISPICDELLDFVTSDIGGVAASGMTALVLKLDYRPLAPSIIAGPCMIALLFGGTAATTGCGVIRFACVPSSYFPVS